MPQVTAPRVLWRGLWLLVAAGFPELSPSEILGAARHRFPSGFVGALTSDQHRHNGFNI